MAMIRTVRRYAPGALGRRPAKSLYGSESLRHVRCRASEVRAKTTYYLAGPDVRVHGEVCEIVEAAGCRRRQRRCIPDKAVPRLQFVRVVAPFRISLAPD